MVLISVDYSMLEIIYSNIHIKPVISIYHTGLLLYQLCSKLHFDDCIIEGHFLHRTVSKTAILSNVF